MPQINFNLESIDDQVIGDGTPSFNGGMVSNQRANLLEVNESASLINTDIDKFGKIRTRRGSDRLGAGAVATPTPIQGLTYFQNETDNYLVAANNGRLYKWADPVWTQIATGGVQDNDVITFLRTGAINFMAGYDVGVTILTVDGFVGEVYAGQKLYFHNNLKTDFYEYTIESSTPTGGNTTQIVLEEPGLVFKVYNNWGIYVKQTATVNNVAGYPGGTTTIAIDEYVGIVNNGEYFAIADENVLHLVSSHTPAGANTTGVTFSPAIQGAFVAGSVTAPFSFAHGVNKLFWAAGASIYAWDGVHTTNLGYENILDRFIPGADGAPPAKVHWIAWFQNRLIAGALEDELDTVYFSDFLDPTRWSIEFQSTRVGGGESDPIKAIVPWTDLNLVIFKLHSIYVVNCDPSQNPNPDDPSGLVASFAIKLVNRNVGCPAPRTVVQVGGAGAVAAGDIFFLSDSGVRSIKRVIAAENQQEIGDPLSAPVQDIIDRINRAYIDRSVAFYHENRYFLAIPIDGATEPNAVLVYHTILQKWLGMWLGWLPTAFSQEPMAGGVPRMVIGHSNGLVYGWLDDVRLIDETDESYDDEGFPILTQILTRAYTLGDFFCPKTGLNYELEFDQSAATVGVQVILDMVPQSDTTVIDTLTGVPVYLPATLPFTLPVGGILRKSFDLQQYGPWRELQLLISSEAGKLQMRSIRVSAFYDTLTLQSP